jgi:Ca2+-dependent lipid-binding protein
MSDDDDESKKDSDDEEEDELDDERLIKLRELEAFADTLKLQLRLWDCTNLEKVDMWGGRNDVYCVIFDVHNQEVGRTDVIRETLAPSWDAAVFEFSVPLDLEALELRIEVWNEDPGKDVFLGSAVLDGATLLGLTFEKNDMPLKKQPGLDEKCVGGAVGISRVNLERLDIQIWNATELKQADAFGGKNDAYCTVKIGERELFRSPVVHDTLDPTWETALCHALLPENSEALILVEMWAHEETGEDDYLGHTKLDVAAVRSAEERQLMPKSYELEKKEKLSKRKQKFVGGHVEYSARLTGQAGGVAPDLRAQVLQLEAMLNATKQFRRLAVRIDGLTNLPMTDVGDQASGVEPDTYCQVYWNDRHIHRTTTKVDMKNPTWNWEIFEVELPVEFESANLRVEVWDHDTEADDFLGEVILSAEALLGLGVNARKDLELQKKAADKKKFKKGQIIQVLGTVSYAVLTYTALY